MLERRVMAGARTYGQPHAPLACIKEIARMQKVYLCHINAKQGGWPIAGVFSSLDVAHESWAHSYHRTDKKITFSPNVDMGVQRAYNVFADQEHVGYIVEQDVWETVEHL